ncbi:hypothetical protein CIW83_13695 [Tissierella sp. P1]|uniref:hypothetical protein n=1 Tax=Tissierella sp. P1 TaxID=1280483 RepID=UPI000BA0DB2D|nr:hypothetical protein [Tissierella sp. P1]OZV11699.1 hypothetical protein CIW83_13695 [Tissierella sp. P1]
MDGKERMKDLYKYFGVRKEEDQEMYSIANIFYEMGTKEDEEESIWRNLESRMKFYRSKKNRGQAPTHSNKLQY